jgi:GYF domain 2
LLSDLSVLRHEMSEAPVAPAVPASARPPAAHVPAESAPGTPTAPATKMPGGAGAGSVAGMAAAGRSLKYWVRLRGKVAGPFDLLALQRQLKQGQISRLHEVSTDQTTWKRATDVDGLYGPAVV